jgi:hypothetical protein
MYKKLVNLRPEQKDALDEIQEIVNENGAYVSIMRLMQDSIQIFIEHYKNEAIERYSPSYYENKNKLGDD